MTSKPQTEHRRRLLPAWAKGLLALFAVGFVVFGFVVLMGFAATAQWSTFTKGIRGRGQPITLAEIEARREPIPEEQNSALFLRRQQERFASAQDEVNSVDSDYASGKGNILLGVTSRWVEDARAFLDKHKEVLPELLPILDMPDGRYPLDLNVPAIQVLLPDLSHLRGFGKLARMAALFAAIDGRQQEAVGWITVQFRIAASLDGEPIVISRLVQMAVERLAATAIEECLAVGEFSDGGLATLSKELDLRLERAAIVPALMGERAMFVDTCECMMNGKLTTNDLMGLNSGPNAGVWSSLARLPVWLMRKNQIKGTQLHTRLIDAGEDLPALRKEAMAVEGEAMGLSRLYVVVRIMMPSLTRAITLHTKTIAALRCARAAVAAEQFRLREGHWPASIAELAGEYAAANDAADADGASATPSNVLPIALIDPFDNQPLRLQTTESGMVIYSVDENLNDDGGDVGVRPGVARPPDVGFRLLNPDRRGLKMVEEPGKDGGN